MRKSLPHDAERSSRHSPRPSGIAMIAAARCVRARFYVALVISSTLGAALPATQSFAQSATEQIAAGDRESVMRHSVLALDHYERALQLEPRNYDALCKASREAVDLGEADANAGQRSSLYARATDYAKRAIAVNANDAEAHFHLARALGRTALTLGAKERVKYAGEIRTQALRAIELQPRHAGALHVMGVWNAEVMRLSKFERLFAKTFLGGAIFSSASWAEAVRYMQEAVNVEPNRLVHRLDLARALRDSGRTADARLAYQAAIKAPDMDATDDANRRVAQAELNALR